MAEGITVKFSATDAGFSGTVAKVNNSMKNMDDNTRKVSGSVKSSFASMAKAGAALAVGFGAIKAGINAIRGTLDTFTDALDMGGRLNDLSSRTGESAGKLLILERAFANAGSSAEKVGPVINKLQKFIVEGKDAASDQAKVMTRLGLSYNELINKTPTEQLQAVAKGLAGVSNDAERGALAVKVFGKSGGELLPFLRSFDEGLNDANKQVGSLANTMDTSAEAFDAISDNLTVIKGKAVEVAAGFLEKATPALLSFTNLLAGIDAGSIGASLMDSFVKVADVLVGIFISPMKAVEAIGSTLNAYFREAGNLYLNALITGGKFLVAFWSSEIPEMIYNYVSSSLGKAYIESQKILVDGFNNVIKFFESDFSKATGSVVDFLFSSFSNIAKFFGSDLFNAITNPIDFVSGKLASAFTQSAVNGGITFKSAFSEGITTSLDKLSTGLDVTSKQYGKSMSSALDGIGSEFGKIVEIVDSSNTDFFGGAEATEKMKNDIKAVEESGKKFRESMDKTYDMRKDFKEMPQLTFNMKDHLIEGATAMKSAATELKEVLLLSQQIGVKINEAIKKDQIDPGGKIEKRINEKIAEGDFTGATRLNKQLEQREKNQNIQDVFGSRKAAKDSLQDAAKKAGLDTFRKGSKELREELDKLATEDKKRQQEMIPGQGGKPGEKPGGKGPEEVAKEEGNAVLNEIKSLVDAIKTTINKIEPKLPTAALGT